MTKTILFLLATLFAVTSFGQAFEGVITYRNTFKSKQPNLTSEQFAAMMGTEQEYYIKDGNYKSVVNGTLVQWQLYVNKDNKLYTRLANSPTLLWNDGSVNKDSVISYTINKSATDILGYTCDELVLTCKSGIQTYYFSSKLGVDAKLFANHNYGNWYDYLKHANAIPLKMIVDNEQFTMESLATAVKEVKLDKSFFDLPPNAQTVKSPY